MKAPILLTNSSQSDVFNVFFIIGLDFSEKFPIGVFMMDGCS